jgi:hypothetical protein
MERQLRRWLPVLLVVLALSLAAVATTGPGVTGRALPPPPPNPELVEPAEDEEEEAPVLRLPEQPVEDQRQESRALAVLAIVYTVLMVLLVVGVLAYLAFHWLRELLTTAVHEQAVGEPATQPDGAAAAQEVRDALRAGLADIDAGGDARRAVIACWLRLERVAAAVGSARLASDTPADLVSRLLSRYQVSREALEQLAEAYRRARYAPAEVGDDLLRVARRALRDVDAELAPLADAAPGSRR